MKNTDSSVNQFILRAQAGDPNAQQEIWDRFFPQLLELARLRLHGGVKRVGDEEDVALSVLNSYFTGAQENKFPEVRGRDELWRLLSRMTQRKAVDWIRFHSRQKRHVMGESALMADAGAKGEPAGADARRPIDGIASDQPTPVMELIVIEECQRLMKLLPDELRGVVLRRLEGHSNLAIAQMNSCSLATIERRMKLVREIWSKAENERIQPT